MSALWQHRLVNAVQMGPDVMSWFRLEPIDGVRKNSDGSMTAYLKDVVLDGLLRPGLSIAAVGNNWLCQDEEGRWWVLSHLEFTSLDPERHVTLWPNEATWRQVAALKAADKLKKDFEAMSEREQKEIYEMYPDLFIKI